MGPDLIFLLLVRFADLLYSGRIGRKVDQILDSDRLTDKRTDGRTGRNKHIMSLPCFEKLSSEHFLLLQDPSRKKEKEEK